MYKGDEGEEEPEWVKNEREQFSSYRDKDGDGFLNADEVRAALLCAVQLECTFEKHIVLIVLIGLIKLIYPNSDSKHRHKKWSILNHVCGHGL